jgi:hypothetical protein
VLVPAAGRGRGGEAMSYPPFFPKFLTGPDPDRDPDYVRRAAYAYPHRDSDDRPMKLNFGYGQQPFTVEDALAWAERRATSILGESNA